MVSERGPAMRLGYGGGFGCPLLSLRFQRYPSRPTKGANNAVRRLKILSEFLQRRSADR